MRFRSISELVSSGNFPRFDRSLLHDGPRWSAFRFLLRGNARRLTWILVLGALALTAACNPDDLIIPPPADTPVQTAGDVADEPILSDQVDQCQGDLVAIVEAGRVNVRAQPYTGDNIVHVAMQGDVLRLIQRAEGEGWHQVVSPQDDSAAWIWSPLTRVGCFTAEVVSQPLNTVAQAWSRGDLQYGVAYVRQTSDLYEEPSPEAAIVGQATRDEILVVSEIVRNAENERWARLRALSADGKAQWIPARWLLSMPDHLLGLVESDAVQVGSRLLVMDLELLLSRLTAFPAGDAGLLYARSLYLDPDASSTAPECVGEDCAALETLRREDGSWTLRYEGRSTEDRSELSVDFVVPLYEVHVSNGWQWNEWQRRQFTRDLGSIGTKAILSDSMRMRRGLSDPVDWLPASLPERCRYVADWILVKNQWKLSVDPLERDVLADTLAVCDDADLETTARFAPLVGRDALRNVGAQAMDAQTANVFLECNARREILTVVNGRSEPVNLLDWHVHDENNQNRFSLPRWMLAPGERVDLGSGGALGDLQLSEAPVWNNNGDTAYLYDADYRLVATAACQ